MLLLPWWLVLLQGIVTLGLGVLLLVWPIETLLILVTFLGAYWLVSGIVTLASVFVVSEYRGWRIVSGLLGIVAGVLVLLYPFFSTLFIPSFFAIFIGVWGILIGVLNIVSGVKGAGLGATALGIVSIILGILLLAHPLVGAAALVFVLGIFGVIGGITLIAASFTLRT
ncbi:HdeD family acid-resistance protein [Methanoculleus frigidifontis]|nr:DUF308 domain-containing protein [Methanoculleus sp. FWC-SCC1]